VPKFYQFGGESPAWVYNWKGYAYPGVRSGESLALSDYETFPTALTQNSGVSVLSTGPERTTLNDGPDMALGLFGSLSENEKRLAMIAAVGIAGFLGWRWWRKRR
jgi:hypothetical protein